MLRPSDGAEYYAYILLYFDNILCIYHDAESFPTRVDKYFNLKPNSIDEPDMYLGSKLRSMNIDDDVWDRALIPSQNVQESC